MAAAKSKTADSSPLVGEGLGRIAYEAHGGAVGGKTAAWGSLDHDVAAAWCAAAQAVITATIGRNS
jgi:hypothetical protein